jgi:DNA-binding response OmpR family regulator
MAREAPTVLVVDDDQAARRLVSIWLGERGFEVHEAQDGESALREAARLDPDVVLLDWRLPDQSGPSLCAILSRRTPRPAIVMLTGLEDPRDRNVARKAGADDYFVKGVNPDVLAHTLRQLAQRAPNVPSAAPTAPR